MSAEDLRARLTERLKWACGHFQDDPECAELTADAVLTEPLVAEFIASLDQRCSCDGDPIECNHEAARGQAEALLSAAQTAAKAERTSERDQLRAAVERVREIHKREVIPLRHWETEGCKHCGIATWPCPTIRALDQAPAAEQDGGGR